MREESGLPSRRFQDNFGSGMPAMARQLSIADSPMRTFCGSRGWISSTGRSRAETDRNY